MSNGNADESSVKQALTVLNTSETAVVGDRTGTKVGTRDAKRDADATDGLGSWANASSGTPLC